MSYFNNLRNGYRYLQGFTRLEKLDIYNPKLELLYSLRGLLYSMPILGLLGLYLFFVAKVYFTDLYILVIYLLNLVTLFIVVLFYIAFLGAIKIPVGLLDFQKALNQEFINHPVYYQLMIEQPLSYLTLSYGVELLIAKDPQSRSEIWKLLKQNDD